MTHAGDENMVDGGSDFSHDSSGDGGDCDPDDNGSLIGSLRDKVDGNSGNAGGGGYGSRSTSCDRAGDGDSSKSSRGKGDGATVDTTMGVKAEPKETLATQVVGAI